MKEKHMAPNAPAVAVTQAAVVKAHIALVLRPKWVSKDTSGRYSATVPAGQWANRDHKMFVVSAGLWSSFDLHNRG